MEMMILYVEYQNQLEQLVINCIITNLAGYDDNGNKIITKTDLPVLALLRRSKKWRIDCTEFVPIPGSGDFQKEFKDEESAINYVIKYFFEKNEHIDELNKYLKNCREKRYI